ncbi:S8 family peptidase [Microbacterium sp. BH-3-3-3]|uniref:S8 family peptidase n=1 Tax=Microbacterium sp. BH-3-3-3 TaxID=1906742 RepID=UPI0011A95D72|nr:S8 family peptidase [Microbacterium sp. BH-3-3-3]
MTDRTALDRLRRWGALGLAGGLLLGAGIVVAVSAPGGADALPATAASLAVDPAPTSDATPPSEAVVDDFPIPADATDAERQQIKLSYDIVTVPADQREQVLAIPGVTAAGQVTLGDEFYAAVPVAASDAVREALPDARVTPNPVVRVAADQSPVGSWGIDAVDNVAGAQDQHYLYDSTGAGTTVFVVDTGVWADHPDFGGRVDAAAGKDFMNDGRGTTDCQGHGTMVAGVVGSSTYGVAKQARIVPVRVFGCYGEGNGWDVIAALGWISDNFSGQKAVVNLSLGTPEWDTLDNASSALVDKGFVVVAAVGNDQVDACTVSPARAPKVIAVGATEPAGDFLYMSNRGPCVDVLAPGGSITSTSKDGGSGLASGTSLSSPHVAGLAARLLQEHPTWKAADVSQSFANTGARGHVGNMPANTTDLLAVIPAEPKITALTASTVSAGTKLSWTTNGIGTFTSFAVTVTDTTTGRSYPVTVSGSRSSTVFTNRVSGHAYTVSISGSARMPSGASVTPATVTASVP